MLILIIKKNNKCFHNFKQNKNIIHKLDLFSLYLISDLQVGGNSLVAIFHIVKNKDYHQLFLYLFWIKHDVLPTGDHLIISRFQDLICMMSFCFAMNPFDSQLLLLIFLITIINKGLKEVLSATRGPFLEGSEKVFIPRKPEQKWFQTLRLQSC